MQSRKARWLDGGHILLKFGTLMWSLSLSAGVKLRGGAMTKDTTSGSTKKAMVQNGNPGKDTHIHSSRTRYLNMDDAGCIVLNVEYMEFEVLDYLSTVWF